MTKLYIFSRKNSRSGSSDDSDPMTVAQGVEYFDYTLATGAAYQHEKGNYKINTNPKTADNLVKNVNNALNNSAANGYSGTRYTVREVAGLNVTA